MFNADALTRPPRVVGIEQAEVKGAITLDSLERAAHALDCQLVYALVPRKPLDTLVEERATRLATTRLDSTRHTMALEAQAVDTRDEDEQRKGGGEPSRFDRHPP